MSDIPRERIPLGNDAPDDDPFAGPLAPDETDTGKSNGANGRPEPPLVMDEGEYGAAAPAHVLPKQVSDAMTTAAPLRIIEPESWDQQPVPETRWIIRGPLPALAVCSLGGHGETGKSILGLQAGVARALDRDWLGFPATYGKTLIVSCEDPEEQVHIRLAGILRHYGATFADLGDRLRIIDRNDMINSMMDWRTRWEPGEVSTFYCQVMNHALQMLADLIVIDSRYDVYSGEQNDTPQVHQFMAAFPHG